MVADIAAQVEQVVGRAASLFAAPVIEDDLADGTELGDAVATVHGLQGAAQALGGAAAEAANTQVAHTLAMLAQTAESDQSLMRRLTAVAGAHGDAAREASHVLAMTEQTAAAAPELASTEAGEVAVLRQLREQVAAMQRLVSAEVARAAQALSPGGDGGAELL